jgi:hypothetical protein
MEVSQANKFVGQDVIIRVIAGIDYVRDIRCQIVSREGRNLYIDILGMKDYIWLPDVISITPDPNPPVEQWDGTDVEPTFRFTSNGGSTTPTTPSSQQA